MRVLKINALPEKAMGTATPTAGWTGGAVSPTRQEIIGDVGHIKAGERHWHGARADSPMSH
jgi:hypothetical protein